MLVDTDRRASIFPRFEIPFSGRHDVAWMQTPDTFHVINEDSDLGLRNLAYDVPALTLHVLVFEIGCNNDDIKWRKFNHAVLAGSYLRQAAHVRLQGLRNYDAAIGLLIIFENCDQRAADC